MPKNGRNGNGRRRGRRGLQTGPAPSPYTTLKRTFRTVVPIQLNNTSGSGLNQYAYYSKLLMPEPSKCEGFGTAQATFEFWRLNHFRVKAQIGYNSYNQTYNTINLDALAATQIWTAPDYSNNETISGVSIMSYNNARCHTLSLNALKTVVSSAARINLQSTSPKTIMPANTWLDTSEDMLTGSSKYSGFQLFARCPGVSATNYLPEIQLIWEYDVEFKQPAYQNRPTSFESNFVGSTLDTIPDSSTPDVLRTYVVTSYTINGEGNNIRLVRADGEPGSLDYTQAEFWQVYTNNTSGKYFGDRRTIYTGPEPRYAPLPPAESEATA